MQDQKADRPNAADVPSSSTDPSTTTVPGTQTPVCSNKAGHQPAENPDHVQYPDTWLWESAEMRQPVVGIEVNLKSKEAQWISNHFCWPSLKSNYSLSGFTLVLNRIVRVQNKALWTRFYRQKQKMSQQRQGSLPRERRLFHGTLTKNIDSICTHGFQICRPAANGRRIGKGHYFSREIWYANNFSSDTADQAPHIFTSLATKTSSESGSTGQRSSKAGVDESTKATKSRTADSATAAAATAPQNSRPRQPRRYMLLSSVLIGRSHLADKKLGNLPKRLLDRYDSCFQRLYGSVQYVVYNDSQAYPQYVIEYLQQLEESSRSSS